MKRVTQNAPFGTDNTPQLEVKIVGGKRVEILARNDESEQNVNGFNTYPKGPHGTPSMLTQPIFRAYEFSDLQGGYKTANQHEVARQISSFTSPFGDRSQSFRHGAIPITKKPVLPPIGASQPAGSSLVKEDEFFEPFDLHTQNNTENSMELILSQKLRSFPSYKIKDMYIELSSFDRQLSGYVSETQLSLVALRHGLPLKPSLMKLAFRRFADDKSEPNQINYEKFLNSLSQCLTKSGVPPQQFTPKIPENYRSRQSHSPVKMSDPPATNVETLRLPSNTCDEKLTSLLKEQLSGSEEVYFNKLQSALASADRLGNGELKAEVIQDVCVRMQIPLTSSVVTKMLQNAEIAQGVVNWREFIEPLMHAERQLFPEHSFDATRCPTTQSFQHSRNDSTSVKTDVSQQKSSRKSQRNSELNSSGKNRTQTAGWDEREPIPRIPDDAGEDGRRMEAWKRNFNCLAHALRNYHPYKQDNLPRKEVERMVANYNLIYSLGLLQTSISDAIERAVTSHSKSNDQQVSVEKLLNILSHV